MKKSLKILATLSVITLVLVGCNNEKETQINNNKENSNINNVESSNNDDNNIEIESQPINENYNTKEIFESIENTSKLDESKTMTEEQLKEEFEFNKYDVLEKEIRTDITEDSITEVGIIKLTDNAQTEEIMGIILRRKEELDAKYADNEKIMNILSNSDNFVIKQEAGVVKYVIAENASSIEI